jgi:dipeptidyl aminopeptidase/acylaminoacyl peptidase
MSTGYYNTNKCLLDSRWLADFLLLFFVLVSCSVLGQVVQKRIVTEVDYQLWSYLQAEAISDDGQWISYRNYYQNTDTLFTRNIKNKKMHHFVQGQKGVFVGDSHYLCITPDAILHIVDLKSGGEKLLHNIASFEITKQYIISLSKNGTLSIYNLQSVLLHSQKSAMGFTVSPDENVVAVTIQDDLVQNVVLIELTTLMNTKVIAQTDVGASFSNLTWSKDSKSVALVGSGAQHSKLYCYHLIDGAIKTFSTTEAIFPKTMNIYASMPMKFSDNGKRVFFKIRQYKELNVVRKPNDVQVWNAQDKYIYPRVIETERWTQSPKQAMWEPESGRFLQITDIDKPFGASAGDESFALKFNPQDYEPQNKSEPDKDVYIMDFATGESKLILKKHIGGSHNLLASPAGKYVSYFSEGQWYVYDISKGSHTMVSKSISYPLSVESDTEKDETGYGAPGWEVEDKSMLIYDEFDIWKVMPDGSNPTRLTNGREQDIRFRILPQSKLQRRLNDSRVITSGEFNFKDELLLSARSSDNYYTGFYQWSAKKGLTKICYGNKRISGIMKSESGIFAWVEEDVASPRQIIAGIIGGQPNVVVKSNAHHEKFTETKVEVIHYKNSKGEPLKGLLYYPSGYDKGDKYPMVVNVYEKQSNQVHHYRSPGLVNADGFNVANLTAKGYFVLLPDTTYEVGNVGFSALDCVESAVKAVLSKSIVDEKKVGLIGHSFGGFQTNFIITQSKMFACAVAGAATSNFLSSHLSVSKNLEIPNFFIIESGQARMMASPFENMDIYLKNSPVMFAKNVNTPLLSWTGQEDTQVAPTQSMEFFMALRRLEKTHVMLVYPGEGHEMQAKDNAADLTRKMGDWLDYYLKGFPKPAWIGTN